MRLRFPRAIAAAAAVTISCSEREAPPTAPAVPSAPSFAKGGGGNGGSGTKNVKSITVSPSSATVEVGETVQLTATASPTGSATTFAWASSNAPVATVSSTGLVTGVSPGTAVITASAGGKSRTATITVSAPPPPPGSGEVFVGAGDIASCSQGGDEATAALLATISGTVFTLGDNVYDNGTASEYANCYQPSWGAVKSRTRPSPGNHEYNTPNATGYYGYYGSAAGDPAKGYYSYDLGAWHIVVLNSNLSMAAGSTQEQWLRTDLAANASRSCTLAYWHHPRFSSGEHGNDIRSAGAWQALYDFNADVILVGHDHNYERFGPQTPGAVADAARGIRQFVVGTGGRSHYGQRTLRPNSQVFNGTTYGVMKLTLSSGQYAWQFVPVAGGTFTDSGTGSCH